MVINLADLREKILLGKKEKNYRDKNHTVRTEKNYYMYYGVNTSTKRISS